MTKTLEQVEEGGVADNVSASSPSKSSSAGTPSTSRSLLSLTPTGGASRGSTRSGASGASSLGSSIWDHPMPSTPEYDIDPTMSPMLRRYPSFVPLRRKATSIAEVAFFVPSSESNLRKATVMSATFNMTATIIGGGVLSIPLSCARAGLIPFTALMILSALMTDFSLYILCSCARRTGSTSFGRVARASFGPISELFTTFVIFFLVVFIVVGLMVLNQGIWSPIVMELVHSLRGEKAGSTTTTFEDAIVLLVLLVFMLPFLLKRDLTSLRHICYVGFFSIAILCVAMAYRSFELNLITAPGTFGDNVKWAASDMSDILSALPIILLAFLCSFNIISVHCSLVDPTRDRVKSLIHSAVFLSFLVMYVFGLAGYLWSYDGTNGNILLNFDPSDDVIFIGRIGCGVTTLFALPMNLLPCREALLSLAAQLGELHSARGRSRSAAASKEEQRLLLAARSESVESERSDPTAGGGGGGGSNGNGSFQAPGLTKSHTMPGKGGGGYGNLAPATAVLPEAVVSQQKSTGGSVAKKEEVIHRAATLGILIVTYVAAVLAPGVAIVWDIAGSSMAFLVQFILPAACYIRLKMKWRGRRPGITGHLAQAWVLLVFATVGAVLCTAIVVSRLL